MNTDDKDAKPIKVIIDLDLPLTEEERRRMMATTPGCIEPRPKEGLLSWLISKLDK